MNRTQENTVIGSAVIFIRSMTETYGPERGNELWERIAEVLDNDLKGKIFFSMLTGHRGLITLIGFTNNLAAELASGNRISIIRIIREHTGCSLREAINAFNSVLEGKNFTFNCDPLDYGRCCQKLKDLGMWI